MSCVVLGSAAALSFVSYSTVRTVVESNAVHEQDQRVLDALEKPNRNLDQKIRESEKLVARIIDPTSKRSANRKLAGLYESLSFHYRSQNEYPESELALQRAVTLDPTNGTLVNQLASLYNDAARRQTEPKSRATLYETSANYFLQARTLVGDLGQQRALADQSVRSSIQAAKALSLGGDVNAALAKLAEAKRWAEPGSALEREVANKINGLH